MMTEFIIGKRQSGKTTELIKRSAETGAVIMVATGTMAKYIEHQARNMGHKIPAPISLIQFNSIMNIPERRDEREQIFENGILLDELQIMMDTVFGGVPVHAVTVTDHYNKVTTLPGGIDVKED